MKKFGLLIFIVAILVGVVIANLFSFGRVAGKFVDLSFVSGIKGSAVPASEARDAHDFTGVDVGGVFQVDIVVGKAFGLDVEADDNLLQYIKTEVHDGVLKIETTERIKSRNPMRIRIAAPDIEKVGASGACKISVQGVKNSSLSIDISGASKINVVGETAALNVDVSGAGNIEAEGLIAQTARVDASGASKVNLFVTDRLTSNASGASRITYAGNPTSVGKKTSGASTVSQK